MRWKSEVKVECCVVSENDNESLLSGDEVREGGRATPSRLTWESVHSQSAAEIKY